MYSGVSQEQHGKSEGGLHGVPWLRNEGDVSGASREGWAHYAYEANEAACEHLCPVTKRVRETEGGQARSQSRNPSRMFRSPELNSGRHYSGLKVRIRFNSLLKNLPLKNLPRSIHCMQHTRNVHSKPGFYKFQFHSLGRSPFPCTLQRPPSLSTLTFLVLCYY